MNAKGLITTCLLTGSILLPGTGSSQSKNVVMFGGTAQRNMAGNATGIPAKWDVESGLNIKWKAKLGSQTYAGPIATADKVFVGTNNDGLRNPELTGDRGTIMAFNRENGEFLWQTAHPKLATGAVNDWPFQGVASTPAVDGERLFYTSNTCQVVCLDTEGFRDGENDGPVTNEANVSPIDADVIWSFDMIGKLKVFPHNLANSSPLIVGENIYVVTGNGVDESHEKLPSPQAPSFIALNKKTGKLVWQSNLPGSNIMHGQWGNPAFGTFGKKQAVIFPAGDGWLYALEPATGKLIWKFNGNTKAATWEAGGAGSKNNIIATPVVKDNKVYIGMGQDPEHGDGPGALYCIDGTMQGDVTEKAIIWQVGGEDFNRTLSTVAIKDGLLYAADLSGFFYCFEAATGKKLWTYDTFAAVWGSPYFVDNKVFLGDEDGDLVVLKAGSKMEVLAEPNMGSAIYTAPFARGKTLYVAARSTLFAIEKK